MVVACAAAAVGAPAAMAATVSNVHPPDTPHPTTYAAVAGEDNTLTLTPGADPVIGPIVTFAELVKPIDPTTAQLDVGDVDDCTATGTQTATCTAVTTNIDLGDGDDTLRLTEGLPPLAIDGGTGADRLDFSPRSTSVSVDLGSSTVTPGVAAQNVEDVTGTPSNDTLTGDLHNNSLDGGAGANTLRGGAGNDTLRAASASAGDVLSGGAGSDTFFGAASTEILALDQAADTITCSTDGTDAVVANLGAGGVSDVITNPNDCGSINGPVAPSATGTTTDTLTNVIVVPAIGNPRLTQVLAPGKANPADLTPPSASMRTFSRQRITTSLARGVRVRVTCREACGISIALSVDRATAKRLKLDARSTPVVIGTAAATRIVRGNTVLKVKLTKPAKAALKATKRSVRANTQVLVSDASGNGTLLSRHVMLVR